MVKDHFEFSDLPIDCIKSAKVENLLDGIDINTYEKAKILNRFTDANSTCSNSQLIITKVLFMRDLERREIIE